MAQFISSPQVSSGPDPNSLFDASKVAGNVQNFQNNQLLMQGKQLDLSNANVAQVSQLAAGLINIQDPNARAEAYSKGIGVLQGMGYAQHAPATLPDDGTLHMLASMGVPVADQYKLQQTKAALDAVWPNAPTSTTSTPTTGAPGSTTGTSATPSGPAPFVGANLPAGVSPDEDQLVRTVYGEARGEPVAGQQAVASVIKTRMGLGKQGVGDVVFAPNQFEAWSDPKNRPGMEALSPTDPQYQAILNNVVRPVMSGQAQDPTGGATNFYNPALQAQLGRSTPSFAQGNQTTIGNHTFFYGGYAPRTAATTAAAPATAPAPTQYAGPGVPPAASTAAPAAPSPPGTPPGSTASPAATPAPDTPWDLPGAPAPDLPPPSTPTAAPAPAAPAAPAQPAPAAAGSPPAIPGRTPPPAPTVTVPPPVPLPPAPPPVDGRYLTAQDYQDLNRMKAGLVTNPNGAQLLQAEIDRRATTNVQRIQNYQAAQEKQRADAIAAQQLQLQGSTAALENWKAANPDAKITQVGGEIITQDPRTGAEIAPRIPVNANREDLAAAQTVARLGPRIAAADAGTGPPVSPEDRALYEAQAIAFQQFKQVTDPISKQVRSVPTRPLPSGFPATATSLPLTQGLSPAQQEIERDPAAFEVNKRNYNDDATDIRALSTSGRQLQSDQVRVKQMQDVLQGFTSGPGTEARTAAAAWFQRWLPSSLTGWEKEPPTLSGAAAAQEFQKLALGSAGQQDQALLGKNAGYRSLELFRNANPNSELLDPTNAHILDMQLVQNQASQDYIQAAQAHFRQNEQAFKTTHQYNSLNDFDADWGAQRNPQVYAAAMGAIAGQPASKWSDGLSVPEYTRALQVVQRAKPSAIVQGRNGPLSMQPNQAAAPPTNAKPLPPGFQAVQ